MTMSILAKRQMRSGNIAMVIDDDHLIRQMVVKGLEDKTERVIDLRDGLSIVESYKKYNPNVVFLDIHLPEKTGPELLQELLAVDEHAYVVMLSADGTKDKVQECIQKGAKSFIVKPFEKEKLHAAFTKCPTVS